MLHAAYRSIVRRLPVAFKSPLKRAALSLVRKQLDPQIAETAASQILGTKEVALGVTVRPQPDGKELMDFVRPETMTEIVSHLANPMVILQMQFARMVIARDRAAALLARTRKVDGPTPAVIHNALGYNLAARIPRRCSIGR
jgi:hypothetical protein